MTQFIQVTSFICLHFLTSKMEIIIVYTPQGYFGVNKIIYVKSLTTMPATN